MTAALVIICQGMILVLLLLSPTGPLSEFTIGDPEPEYCEEESPDGGTAPRKPIKLVGNYPSEGRGTQGDIIEQHFKYYESPPNPEVVKRAVIAVHDTGGFKGNGNVRQVVDVLSEVFNVRIMMPDFGRQDILNWTKVKPGLEAAIAHIKKDWGIGRIGMFGWCAGGTRTYDAAQELAADLKAAVLLHPSNITDSRGAQHVKIPLYIILSNGEKPDIKIFQDIQHTLHVNNHLKAGLMLFSEPHGFAGNDADFTNSDFVMGAERAINLTGRWFARL